jgi:hypothetical protein
MAVDLTEGVIPPPDESVDLFEALRQLPLMTDYFYLQMQARNISITDHSLEKMERDLLTLEIEGEHAPVAEAIFLNAWSQMWVFGFFELMRTWKALTKDFYTLSRKLTRGDPQAQAQLIRNKTAEIKKSSRLTLDRGHFHFKALRWVVEDPAGAETALNKAIERTNSLSRMLAEVRIGFCVTSITGPNGGAELYER